MLVTIHLQKTNCSKLIEAALAGEEVIIAKGRRPDVRIVPVPQNEFTIGPSKRQLTGSGPDFFEPMSEDELARGEGGE